MTTAASGTLQPVLGRLLCAIGLHRWKYLESFEDAHVTTRVRCNRRCRRWSVWTVVDRRRQ